MSELSPDHADIYRRIEKVEVDVAVLDSKSNRLHEDLVDLKSDMKANGIIARDVKSKVEQLPKLIMIIMSLATLAMGVLTYAERTIS